VPRALIFTATFNEKGNVEAWVRGAHRACPDAELLVIDDSSPDGTGELLDDIAKDSPYLEVVHRSGKLGLASAHLHAMRHALDRGYDLLVTMDADGSHQPWQIPDLLSAADGVDFVIGTRYRGGHHRAGLGRRVLSWGANSMARTMLPTGLSEYTTSFRVFDRKAMAIVVNASLRDEGYAFFLETVEAVYQADLSIAEVPIEFTDRVYGSSKIPRTQIVTSVGVLLGLWQRRLVSGKRRGV
jgi:dolichol-phosphate mannosyltransferase